MQKLSAISTVITPPMGNEVMNSKFDGLPESSAQSVVHAAEACLQIVMGWRGEALCLLVMLAAIVTTFGQVQESWVARYNGHGSDNDSLAAMTVDSAGNVYVTGGSSADYATVKYSPTGAQLWTARYSSSGNDEDHATAIAVDSVGNV